jgi:hypothetical protein
VVPLIFYMTGSTVSHSFPVSAPGCIPCDTLRSGALVAPGNKKKWFNAIPQTIYRQQVSILCPRGYESRALPLRHAGELCA